MKTRKIFRHKIVTACAAAVLALAIYPEQTYAQTGKMSLLEKEADDYVMELFRKHRYEIFTIAPMIGYLLAKEREAQAVRILMVAKENGLPIDMVKERLREQYE